MSASARRSGPPHGCDEGGASWLAAHALLVGDPARAAEMLGGWRFADDAPLTARFLGELVARPPHARVCGERSPDARIAWGLDALARIAAHLRARADEARRRHGLRASDDDESVRALWARWFDGDAWAIQADWEDRFLPDARSAFKAVLVTSGLHAAMGSDVLTELGEWFFFDLLDGGGETPGWADLAARTLETDPTPDLGRASAALPERAWGTVARCLSSRGYFPATARLLVPEAEGASERALLLAAWLAADTQALPLSLDLHLAQRLLDTWRWPEAGTEGQDLRVLSQNRGRATARLRAVLQRADLCALRRAVLGLDCLAARTHAAVRCYARDHARRQVASHFALRAQGSPTPPCAAAGGVEPIGPEELPALRGWLVMALLRGCLGQLRLWATPGSRAENGGTWGRLLTRDLPESLADPPNGRKRTYHRLRAELGARLELRISEAPQTVLAVASLDPPFTRARFHAAVADIWHPDLRMPEGGYAGLVCHARAVTLESGAPHET